MTKAHELCHLIGSLPDEQVGHVLPDVRHCTAPRTPPPDSALAWIDAGATNSEWNGNSNTLKLDQSGFEES